MKLYFAIQILRLVLMCSGSGDGADGESRSCSACRGEKGWKICQVEEDKKKGNLFHE